MNCAKWQNKLSMIEFGESGPVLKQVEPREVDVLAVAGEWAMVSYREPVVNRWGVELPPFIVPSAELDFVTPNS